MKEVPHLGDSSLWYQLCCSSRISCCKPLLCPLVRLPNIQLETKGYDPCQCSGWPFTGQKLVVYVIEVVLCCFGFRYCHFFCWFGLLSFLSLVWYQLHWFLGRVSQPLSSGKKNIPCVDWETYYKEGNPWIMSLKRVYSSHFNLWIEP